MAKATKKPGRRQKKRFFLTLPEWHRKALREATKMTKRTATAEGQIALEELYRRLGIEIPT